MEWGGGGLAQFSNTSPSILLHEALTAEQHHISYVEVHQGNESSTRECCRINIYYHKISCAFAPPVTLLLLQGCEPPEEPTAVDSTDLELAEGYEYMGCFQDKAPMSERDMPLTSKKEFALNTPATCASRCLKKGGATFFGLQNGVQ